VVEKEENDDIEEPAPNYSIPPLPLPSGVERMPTTESVDEPAVIRSY
jgi:hypothetical protein